MRLIATAVSNAREVQLMSMKASRYSAKGCGLAIYASLVVTQHDKRCCVLSQAAGGRGEQRDAGIRPAEAAVADQGDADASMAGEASAAGRGRRPSGAEGVRRVLLSGIRQVNCQLQYIQQGGSAAAR